jgi:nucleotide-binding universal stress UspA family protein
MSAPNSMRTKAIPDGEPAAGLDPARVAAAEAVLFARAGHYPDTALADVDMLANDLSRARNKVTERTRALRSIAATAHSMRCHGSTYGFPLVTKIGLSLYEYSGKAAGTDEQLEVIEAHIEALRAILVERLTEDGGPVGQEVVHSLRQVVEGVPAERRK